MTGLKQMLCFIFGFITTVATLSSLKNGSDINIDENFRWKYKFIASKFLFCPNCCKKLPMEIGSCFPYMYMFNNRDIAACCSWYAKPYWMFREYSYLKGYLYIEYKSVKGKAKIAKRDEHELHDLVHHRGFLEEFPDNICDFNTLVKIDFSWNRIKTIPNLNCLSSIDSLILPHNRIKIIESSTLAGLSNLRTINFSYNRIVYLEPGSLSYRPGSLLQIELQYNNLKSIDVNDVIIKRYFKYIKLYNNNLSTVTNLQNNTGFGSGSIGGGLIQIMNNALTHFPMFHSLGFEDRDALKIAFRYTIDMRNNKWVCDCKMWSGYLVMASQAMEQYATLGFVKCLNPPHLKGYSIAYFRTENHTADLLICNITEKEKCPQRCYCFDQPSQNRVVVNCASKLYINMPHVAPNLSNLDIDLSHNKITYFRMYEYLKRTVKINLSFNFIVQIDPSIFGEQNLKFIDLRHNPFQTLQRSLQLKDPCSIALGDITLKCTCDMMWIKLWLGRQQCSYNQIICETYDSFVNASYISKSDLCEDQTSNRNLMGYILLGITIISFGAIALLYFHFKYELLLLFRKHGSKRKNGIYRSRNDEVLFDMADKTLSYDVYLSFYEDNEHIRKWVVEILIRNLENKGYKICLPCRDFNVGGIREEEIRREITKCKSFIILLSEEYLEDHFSNLEWKQIWNNYKSDNSKRILIVNYDIMESAHIKQRNMKAFVRLGYTVDFGNTDKRLTQDIICKLGQPLHLQRY